MNSPIFLLQTVINLFFPWRCAGCDSDLISPNRIFCIHCESDMPVTEFENFNSNPVEKIFWGRLDIQSASAHLYFTPGSPLQHSLHLLKYKGRKDIGRYFGKQMGIAIQQSGRFDNLTAIIPLPLYKDRERKRGYNQSKLIAEGVSACLNIPVMNDAVQRFRKTSTQTRKNRIERWSNMESSFKVTDGSQIVGQHILLVDDVVTTGATLEACAGILSNFRGVRISIACLAYTVLY